MESVSSPRPPPAVLIHDVWFDGQVLNVLGRSRVSKLFVMRSLLRTDEEAHNPDLYMVKHGEEQGAQAHHTFGAERRPAALGRGNARVAQGDKEEDNGPFDDEEEGQRAGGRESIDLGGSARFHQQLWSYREHLKTEVPCVCR